MLELISPAGTEEAVIAAVQSGADTICLGLGFSAPGKGERDSGFSRDTLERAIRYCRVRGCRVVVAVSELVTDAGMQAATDRAIFAAENGADAILVQDLGVVGALRSAIPEVELWGSVSLGIHSVDGVRAAEELGFRRIFLAPELSLEEIRQIGSATALETIVYVHGSICFAHNGQCYFSALRNHNASDSLGHCSFPCREALRLGGRLDEKPLSIKDICLLDSIPELESAGVTGVAVEGRGRTPEYVAFVTKIYSRMIRERVFPSREERLWLENIWSPGGLTDGYLTEKRENMLAQDAETAANAQKVIKEIRRDYMSGECRRIPLRFWVIIQPGKNAVFAAMDARGNKAAYEGIPPSDLRREGITEGNIEDILYRTDGTPFAVTEVNCRVAPNMDYPEERLAEARDALINEILKKAKTLPRVRVQRRLERPHSISREGAPKKIFQVSKPWQLTEELLAERPDELYFPLEFLRDSGPVLARLCAAGLSLTAVLPPRANANELPELEQLLCAAAAAGVQGALAGSLDYIRPVRKAGLRLRGDFGLNVANSWTNAILRLAGFSSVTASFQLSARDIRAMAKTTDTEMIVYGRLPVMVSDQCVIRHSAERCSCESSVVLADRNGNEYPVEKAFGCRNVFYDAHKIFLADRPDVYTGADLWAVRLLFTTESARECVDVARRYAGRSTYMPNNLSRGLYVKGAL